MRTQRRLEFIRSVGTGDLDGDNYSIITTANEDIFMVGGANPGQYEGASLCEWTYCC